MDPSLTSQSRRRPCLCLLLPLPLPAMRLPASNYYWIIVTTELPPPLLHPPNPTSRHPPPTELAAGSHRVQGGSLPRICCRHWLISSKPLPSTDRCVKRLSRVPRRTHTSNLVQPCSRLLQADALHLATEGSSEDHNLDLAIVTVSTTPS